MLQKPYICIEIQIDMIDRYLIVELEAWADRPGHKPLVLRGARQVGKSTLVEQFSKRYDTYLKLNLENKAHADLFREGRTVQEIIPLIYFINKAERTDGRTLLFIDEIQTCPEAVAMLRYFYEEASDMDVIAAGSLLESLIDNHISFPVGRVEYKAVRPCSFLEFLGAAGFSGIRQALEAGGNLSGIHDLVKKQFNIFSVIGGMPEIVSDYTENHDLVRLDTIYETLVTGYRDDVEKYTRNNSQRNIIRHILNAGWWEAGARIKFEKFGHSQYRSRDMSEAFKTLSKTMLLELVYPVTSAELPIMPSLNFAPKLLWMDVGLVNYVGQVRASLLQTEDISSVWSGRIAEQVVGQELISGDSRFSSFRSFYVGGSGSSAEVDFVIRHDDMVVPVEVKSGINSKLKSLHSFMDKSPYDVAVRFWPKEERSDVVKTDKGRPYRLISLPYYYAGVLDKVLTRIL